MAFDAEKATYMSAYFIFQAGGKINYMKLIKLLYLAERESFQRYGWSMSDDYLVSMPQGPVLSNTLNLIHRDIDSAEIWNKLISETDGYDVHLKQAIKLENFDMSRADFKILDSVWNKFGHMDQWELVRYTHQPENCPEWENPGGSSKPISIEKLLKAVGFSQSEAKDVMQRKESQDRIDDFLTSL